MESEVSEILKEEIEAGQRDWDEMRFCVPILKRIFNRLNEFLKEEQEDKNNQTCFGLFLAMKTVKAEIDRLEGNKNK